MNWNNEEQTKEELTVMPLAWSFHKTLALAIVEANLKHAPDVVQETSTKLTTFCNYSLHFLTALSNPLNCVVWTYQLLIHRP